MQVEKKKIRTPWINVDCMTHCFRALNSSLASDRAFFYLFRGTNICLIWISIVSHFGPREQRLVKLIRNCVLKLNNTTFKREPIFACLVGNSVIAYGLGHENHWNSIHIRYYILGFFTTEFNLVFNYSKRMISWLFFIR